MIDPGSSSPIRVLVADDSGFMRASLKHILESDSSIEVLDTAKDGEEAVEKTKSLRPDVVLLDIEMPRKDGIAALSQIMAECPTPVLMISAMNKRDATIVFRSLEYGAVDFIAKPSDVISYDIEKISREILLKVRIAAGVKVGKFAPVRSVDSPGYPAKKTETPKRMVVIGASTGGPRAVATILRGLKGDITGTILVVQHMGKEFIPSFAESLRRECPLEVSIAAKGDSIRPGKVYLSPGDCDTGVVRDRNTGRIGICSKVSTGDLTPSIDYAMESVAGVYGESSLGVLLTGMGEDGARGMKAIKDAGGGTIAEDRSTCIVFGMPKAAIRLGCVDMTVPLPSISGQIMKMMKKQAKTAVKRKAGK